MTTSETDFSQSEMMAQMGFLTGKVMGDMAGAMTSAMCAVGDRLGLFRALSDGVAVTVEELAEKSSVSPVYLRDWLLAMAHAEYLDQEGDHFSLPSGRSAILADETSPMFICGAFQQTVALLGPIEETVEAFRSGTGLSPSSYGHWMAESMERMSAMWLDHQLVQSWIPAMPAAAEALQAGGRVADVGCGSGRALINLARAFPDANFVGYELIDDAVSRARSNVDSANLSERIRIESHDATQPLPEEFDLVTLFDMLHDVARPATVLENVRSSLSSTGTCLVVESNALGDHTPGPVGSILYGTSVLYCIPTALSWGAEGLGTMGLPHGDLVDLATRSGFSQTRRLEHGSAFNAVYELRPGK